VFGALRLATGIAYGWTVTSETPGHASIGLELAIKVVLTLPSQMAGFADALIFHDV